MYKLLFAAALAAASTGAAQAADAGFAPLHKGSFVVDLRASVVAPENSSPITDASGAATGLDAHVGRDWMPTLGFSYYFTPNLAAELIAGTTRHTIRAVGPGVDVEASRQWVLPPTLTLKYQLLPAARVSPYVGAGVNYMLFYSRHKENGFTVDLDNRFGFALQGGADVAVVGPWQVNADVKKIFVSTTAHVNGGALTSKVRLDPLVLSLGLGRRF
jgi:outer membrane protein